MLGHADLIYRGFVISYGCYDPHNRHLFGTMGDGVVLMADRNPYIYNCLKNENKTLISFGIALDEEQKKRLNDRLLEVFGTFEDFYSDEDLKRKGLPYQGPCDDSVSYTHLHIHAQIIDDVNGTTLVAASSVEMKLENGGNVEAAKTVGAEVAKRALEKNITNVVFDRGGYCLLYTSRCV